jgi:hypothetical protein
MQRMQGTAIGWPTIAQLHRRFWIDLLGNLLKTLIRVLLLLPSMTGGVTKNGFVKFGNDYTIEGIVANIHDILYGQEEEEDDDDLDDGDLKKVTKDG